MSNVAVQQNGRLANKDGHYQAQSHRPAVVESRDSQVRNCIDRIREAQNRMRLKAQEL